MVVEKSADLPGTAVPGCPDPTKTEYSPAATSRVPSRSTQLKSRGDSSKWISFCSPAFSDSPTTAMIASTLPAALRISAC